MSANELNDRLSRISTLWTLIFEAHQEGPAEAVGLAQRRLIERYGGAVYGYLRGAVREEEAADDLFQEFALRFLRGDFRNANPERGRFRDFVKTAVFHLIIDHHKRRKQQPAHMGAGHEPAAAPGPDSPESEQMFLSAWRDELMNLTWLALERFERESGQPYHTMLRHRSDNPLLSSGELADQVGNRLGKQYSIDAVRQVLHRAREKFAQLLLNEVEQSIERVSRDRVEQELIDLGLLTYCRRALDLRFGR